MPARPARPNRRTFLKLSTAAASVAAAKLAHAAPSGEHVSVGVVVSSLTQSEPIRWAASKLRDALSAKGLLAAHFESVAYTRAVLVMDATGASRVFGIPALTEPESIALVQHNSQRFPTTIVAGIDIRGLVYGLLELADRVRLNDDPILALNLSAPIIETTPNKVRSVSRGFCSELEDKPWFYDRAFWTAYLDTLAAARFNRFALTFGLAYDFPRGVTDDYFHLPYPYLVEVPGFEQVHVEPALQPGERQRNLETLQFIAAETARRGLDFQLGIWTHAYQWTDSPKSAHHIVGLTPETHAAYCRDALALLLKACPQITGLTMRIHGESGIPEGSYGFWQTLWESVKNARTPDGKPRVIELDLHAKGLDQRTIEIAQATGMPVKAGAKFWAEHQGLGYHQADIRATEYPKAGVTGTFAVSSGARNFTRYGYGDFYQYPQGVAPGKSLDLLYRVWPGTQRHLTWADPALASGYGRAAHFCGASGMEIMEPLFFKGREGSGLPGGRDAYADKSLAQPAESLPDCDTDKFALTYLTWGRHLYNPDTSSAVHERYLRATYGPAGPALGDALAAASRILPLVTTAWLPSASNHELWLEMFTPLSLLPYTTRPLYTDSPAPHNVSAISPLDPQLFTTIDQHAKDLVSGEKNARYNTSEVIAWLESFVRTSSASLEAVSKAAGPKAQSPDFRRVEEDILILNGLGTYFANIYRAGLFFSLREQFGDSGAEEQSLATYRKARDAWASMAARAQKVYTSDISYGSTAFRRGHWADRLLAIDADLAALEKHYKEARWIAQVPPPDLEREQRILQPAPRHTIPATHTAPTTFHPGSDLSLTITTSAPEAILWYRHVNHGERWLSTPMHRSGDTHTAAIPAAYTNSPYPLQYYFELRTADAATLHPPFNPTLSNQPYYAIHLRT